MAAALGPASSRQQRFVLGESLAAEEAPTPPPPSRSPPLVWSEAALRDPRLDLIGHQLEQLLARPCSPLRAALRADMRAELALHGLLLCAGGHDGAHQRPIHAGNQEANSMQREGEQKASGKDSKEGCEDALRQEEADSPEAEGAEQSGGVQSSESVARAHSLHFHHQHGADRGLDRSDAARFTGTSLTLGRFRSLCHRLARGNHYWGHYFNVFMGVMVIANCAVIGVETQLSLEGDVDIWWFDVVENVFLVLFIAELLVRCVANGRHCFTDGWFILDFVLVFAGVLYKWIINPAVNSSSSSGDLVFLEDVLILRTLRLLRLARNLRMLESAKDFFRLSQGLVGSFKTVMPALFLLLSIAFLFGCLSVELITKSELLLADPDAAEIVHTCFSSLWVSMMTLMQFANADSISAVYAPLVKAQPALAVYFGAVWLSMTVSLMNIIGALLVLNAIDDAKVDAEMEQADIRRRLKQLQPQIRQIFIGMDKNGDGNLSIRELNEALRRVKRTDMTSELKDIIRSEKLVDLFEFLDVDQSGTVDEGEFVQGISHLALSSVPVETTQTLNLLKLNLRMMAECLGASK